MKRLYVWLAVACSFGLATAGCQQKPAAQPAASAAQPASPAPASPAPAAAGADAKGASAAPAATGAAAAGAAFTQEDTGIKVRVKMPELQPFLDKSKQGPIVPALKQDAVPQGLAFMTEQNWILLSYYRDGGKTSLLSVIDAASGNMVKMLELYKDEKTPYTGHAGGVTISKKHAWVSSDQQVYMLNLDDIVKAEPGGKVVFAGSVKSDTRASFSAYGNGVLWIGEFAHGKDYPTKETHYLTNRDGEQDKAWVEGYKLDETDVPAAKAAEGGGAPVPDYILSIPDTIQGMHVVGDKVLLSQSYGRNNASALLQYKHSDADKPDSTATIGSAKVPVWFLDSKNLASTLVTPPMSEGIADYKGNLYLLFESGATKYRISSSYALDRIQLLPLNP